MTNLSYQKGEYYFFKYLLSLEPAYIDDVTVNSKFRDYSIETFEMLEHTVCFAVYHLGERIGYIEVGQNSVRKLGTNNWMK